MVIPLLHWRGTFYLDGTVVTAPLDGKIRTIIRFDAGFLWLKTVPGRHNLEWDKFSWLGELLQDQN